MSFLATEHKTFVHHVSIDPSSTLMATCSSDRTVEVFYRRQNGDDNDAWERGCTMDDHSGPVLRLAWCQHREHGPLLATAGADHWIYIYRITVSTHEGRIVTQPLRWSPVRGFEKDAITDVAFVPPQQHKMLLLSTASLDGCVRLYEILQSLQFPCVCKLTPEADFAAAEDASGGAGGGHSGGSSGAGGAEVGGKASSLLPQTPPSSSAPGAGAAVTGAGGGSGSSGGGGGAAAAAGNSAGPSGAGAGGNTDSGGNSTAPSNSGLRGGGIVSISWLPGAAESTMTLAVGAVSGRFFLYRFLEASNTLTALRLVDAWGRTGPGIDGTAGIVCRQPVQGVLWAPPMGRRFHLCAICSRAEVYILRLNCISPSNHDVDAEGPIKIEVFHHPVGAVSASWGRSATLLYLVTDDRNATMRVLQMRDPRDHSSWAVVSENAIPPHFICAAAGR